MDAFQSVGLEDRQSINTFLHRYPLNEGSECTFSNLYIWGKSEGVRWSIQNECLLLRVEEKGQNPCMLMALAEEERLGDAIEAAIDSMERRGETFHMRSLPGWYVDRMEALFPNRFIFEREPHLDDYIYDAERLRTLQGSKLHGKRNHINKFMSLYGDNWSYEPYSELYFQGCMELEERWAANQKEGGAPLNVLEDEVESVRRALTGAAALGLKGGVLLVDGAVAAFTLGEKIAHHMALIHVEKADTLVEGAYAMINREFITRAFPEVLYVNREEDMGNEGLRRAKRSYGPLRMIEKFGAQQRDG